MGQCSAVFRVLLRMLILPGREQEFEKTWHDIGNAITEHPANLGQWLCRSAEEEGVYYIISDWVDEPRFRTFEHSEQHLEHRLKLHPFRSAGSMTTMHVVYDMTGTAAHVAAARGR
jgi:heme-degrading monooxygenase HmoA